MQDIIAAVATPRGKGGIAVIRISGAGAGKLLSGLFRPCPAQIRPRYMYYGEFLAGDTAVDKGLAVLFQAGHSFTGEETLELHCHGGERVSELLLEAAIACGARPALPGEFTKRAFLNGRMDLSEAEAVGDMIEADSTAAVLLAKQALSGGLRERIEGFRDELTDMLASIEAGIDYPDELPEEETREDVLRRIAAMLEQVDGLIATYNRGRMRKEGISVCILGRPNAGKSSLMNALCGRDSAIVTDIAGTTRDVLHETVEINGLAVHLYDTAGLRGTDDRIERIGVERALKQAECADLVLYVTDGAQGITQEDEQTLAGLRNKGIKYAALMNKSDIAGWRSAEGISISALSGEGIDEVRSLIAQEAGNTAEGLAIASLRHMEALSGCREALREALEAGRFQPLDCVSIDLHEAWEQLGRITGQSVNEEIIDRIFSKFCLGK